VRIYTPSTPTIVHEQAKSIANQSETLTPSVTPLGISKVGFVGLGAMGIGMATSLVKAGFNVCGYDVYEPSKQKFLAVDERASGAKSPAEAAQGAAIFILMVQNATQVTDVLFGAGKAADALPDSSIIILNSTVPPSFVKDLRQRLISLGRKLELIDAPVSGGVARAAKGELAVSWLSRVWNKPY
jgi:3-hydroxyisobutyrate dehydrogenase-like beta-hydroxyacid dehydrogenase